MSVPPQEPIAVVGIGALFPGSTDRHGFWRDIVEGADRIGEVPPGYWRLEDYYDPDPRKRGKTYGRRGGFIPAVPFDPIEHGVPPNLLASTDTAQLLALLVARQVLEDAASGSFAHVDRSRISVILGVASATELAASMASSLQRPVWERALRAEGLAEDQVRAACDRIERSYADWTEATFPGLLGNVVAGRIANRFDLGGTNCVLDAACASSLAAVRMAVDELQSGHSDMVITGGVDALNDVLMFMCFSKTPAMSPTGDCRPFAEDADGTLLGEGVGMLALRRLADAERSGDPIYAVLRGIAGASDGRAKSIYAPRAQGQALAMGRAYAAAGYAPETVELVEAHGTGTVAGDATEAEGLRRVFAPGDGTAPEPWCALGSVKSQIGHTKAAAGAASMIKAVLALHHRVLPPTIKVAKPNPTLGLEGSPFHVNTRARPWVRAAGTTRRAGVSSFGFGGSNFHATLEEYAGSAPRPPRTRLAGGELFLFSAADAGALVAQVQAAATEAADPDRLALAARDSQRGFDRAAALRLAVPASGKADLRAVAKAIAGRVPAAPGEVLLPGGACLGSGTWIDGEVAILCPGQGSQRVEMGAELAMGFDAARAVWDAAVLVPGLERLHRKVFPPPAFDAAGQRAQAEVLTATDVAQPAIGAATLAFLALLRRAGLRPSAVAGHSFGELTALHVGGAFDAPTLLTLAAARGRAMAEAARGRGGAMLAVQAPPEALGPVLQEAPEAVLANLNAPDQTVLAGEEAAIAAAEACCARLGLIARRLPVATAFHSPVVAPAAAAFACALTGEAVAAPVLRVYANGTAAPFPPDANAIRAALGRQVAEPVRFAEMVLRMYEDGIRVFVEPGPGSVLTGFVGKILAGRPHLAVSLDGREGRRLAPFWAGIGRLMVAGIPLDLGFVWEGFAEPAPKPPLSPATVMIDGANYGKPYPPRDVPQSEALPRPAAKPAPVSPPPTERGAAVAETPALPTAPAPAGGDAIAAFERIHRQMAEAHMAAQRALAESHAAYLRATETALRLAAGEGVAAKLAAPAPFVAALPLPLPVAVAEPVRMMAPPPAAAFVPAPPPPAPAVVPARAATSAPAADIAAQLLAVMAEKTGYPVSMLALDMELEADLGIDSIKRVEILAAAQQRIPGLPTVEPHELGALSTLRAIVERLGLSAAPVEAPVTPAAPAADIAAQVLAVVAEKTGYPVSMLALDMELEADLGIDSIKRVEILAAAQQRIPGLPTVEPHELGTLSTLRAIVERLGASAAPAPAVPAPGLLRLGLTMRDRSATGGPAPGFGRGSRVALVGADSAARESFARALAAAGHEVVAENAQALILLSGMTATGDDPFPAAAEAFAALRAVTPPPRALVVLQRSGGDFGLSGSRPDRAWFAGFAALARTAALEWPGTWVKAIDVDEEVPERAAARVAEELTTGGREAAVGLRSDGGRAVPVEVDLPLQVARAPGLPANALLVVSGGARGVTPLCLEALAAGRQLRLCLLGRTEAPEGTLPFDGIADTGHALRDALIEAAEGVALTPLELGKRLAELRARREVRDALARLRAAGAEAEYHACDVADVVSVTAAVAATRRRWGRIDGVVHAAGVLADRRIADKTDAQFASVFAPKVAGLKALLAATASDDLRLLLLFGSVAARRGNPGQADYAMANGVLAAVAAAEARRRGPGCVARAIGWGPWDGGMVDAALKARFARDGIALIAPEAGARAFAAEALAGAGDPAQADVVVVAGRLSSAGAGEAGAALR